ncbi:MAG: hypothetical protein ACHQIM_15585, partial [Sphingobacteriales bacterium]
PLIFITIYLLDVSYFTLIHPAFHNPKHIPGPMIKSNFSVTNWIIVLFLIHAFVTFYFVNTRFVFRKIKTIPDISKQDQFISDFLTPMKRLTKISIWVVVIFFILTTIVDIVKYSNVH